MIVLAGTTDTIKAVLSGTVASTQWQCLASYRDITTSAYTPGRQVTVTNNTTAVTVVSAPDGSTQRVIDALSIYNPDATALSVTVNYDANGTSYPIWKGLLNQGERVEYAEGSGFTAYSNIGAQKTAGTVGAPVSTGWTAVVLSSDVANANASANTLADVTGLSFAVTSGQTYAFRAVIPYTSAATTTGSRWTITGPASPTLLNYTSQYTLTATTQTVNSATAYLIPAASNATSLTAGNVATITGVIKPSGDGTVQVQFASEITVSAITAKAGAILEWIRVL